MRIIKNWIWLVIYRSSTFDFDPDRQFEVEIRWKPKGEWYDVIDRYRFEDVPFMAEGI